MGRVDVIGGTEVLKTYAGIGFSKLMLQRAASLLEEGWIIRLEKAFADWVGGMHVQPMRGCLVFVLATGFTLQYPRGL
tara:strand:- start:416 stop:649 length:234 start_codon:yes stop_codon:yes gene_type:complete